MWGRRLSRILLEKIMLKMMALHLYHISNAKLVDINASFASAIFSLIIQFSPFAWS